MSRVHTFIAGEHVSPGTETRPGKPEWPDALVLVLDRRELVDLLQRCAMCVDARETVEITLHGALKDGEL